MIMETRKLKYTILSLPKVEVQKLDAKSRKRFIMLTSILRDTTLLSKLIYYTKNSNELKIDILKYANTMASIFFFTTFISKIYEMWIFLTKNKILDELLNKSKSSELASAIDSIKNFFADEKKEKLFAFIRNSLGFHYEYYDQIDSKINEAFDKFEDRGFTIFLTEDNAANDVFPSLNTVILISIFKIMDELGYNLTDPKSKMEKLFSLVGEGAKMAMDFCPAYLVEMFLVKWDQKEKEIEIEVPHISSIKLPILVHNEDWDSGDAH